MSKTIDLILNNREGIVDLLAEHYALMDRPQFCVDLILTGLVGLDLNGIQDIEKLLADLHKSSVTVSAILEKGVNNVQ